MFYSKIAHCGAPKNRIVLNVIEFLLSEFTDLEKLIFLLFDLLCNLTNIKVILVLIQILIQICQIQLNVFSSWSAKFVHFLFVIKGLGCHINNKKY